MSSAVQQPPRIEGRQLIVPAVGQLFLLAALLYVVAFDQGALGTLATSWLADSGGVLHEFFHDARHLLGVPCH